MIDAARPDGNEPEYEYPPTRNEAAERLLDFLDIPTAGTAEGMLNEALAAERRATVDRIKYRYEVQALWDWEDYGNLGAPISETKLLAILDEEAAR